MFQSFTNKYPSFATLRPAVLTGWAKKYFWYKNIDFIDISSTGIHIRHVSKKGGSKDEKLLEREDLYKIPEMINNCQYMILDNNNSKRRQTGTLGVKIYYDTKTIVGLEIMEYKIISADPEYMRCAKTK